MSKKQREVEDVLNLLNFKMEATDSDQAIQNKISSRVEKAPKILVFTKKLLIEKMNALSYMIQDQEIAELNKKLKNSQNMIEELDNEIRQIKQVKEWADEHEEKIKRLVTELIQQEYENVGPNLYKFYKKLSRINTIKNITNPIFFINFPLFFFIFFISFSPFLFGLCPFILSRFGKIVKLICCCQRRQAAEKSSYDILSFQHLPAFVFI